MQNRKIPSPCASQPQGVGSTSSINSFIQKGDNFHPLSSPITKRATCRAQLPSKPFRPPQNILSCLAGILSLPAKLTSPSHSPTKPIRPIQLDSTHDQKSPLGPCFGPELSTLPAHTDSKQNALSPSLPVAIPRFRPVPRPRPNGLTRFPLHVRFAPAAALTSSSSPSLAFSDSAL